MMFWSEARASKFAICSWKACNFVKETPRYYVALIDIRKLSITFISNHYIDAISKCTRVTNFDV